VFNPSLRGFDIYIEVFKERSKLMSRFNEFLNDVKELVRGFTPNAEVYLFGSYAEGRVVASSDIDILVIVDEGVELGLRRLRWG
jgi:predicted nucleotidyltransferase